MTVYIKKIYNQSGQETRSILSVYFQTPTTLHEKYSIENKLIDYAFTTLYPIQGLNIYRDMYVDTPSITVIINMDDLMKSEILITLP